MVDVERINGFLQEKLQKVKGNNVGVVVVANCDKFPGNLIVGSSITMQSPMFILFQFHLIHKWYINYDSPQLVINHFQLTIFLFGNVRSNVPEFRPATKSESPKLELVSAFVGLHQFFRPIEVPVILVNA